MKVLYVCNNAFMRGNGVSSSARTAVKYLREAGIEAELLSSGSKDPSDEKPKFELKRLYFPIFQPVIDANGYCYAARDQKIIRQAVEWADIVHIEEAFPLEKSAIKWAEKLGKPVVGTFHLYTQSILAEIPLSSFGLSNRIMMTDWRNNFYNHCSHIQCPSLGVKRVLEKWNFTAKLHHIPNGIRIPQERVIASTPQMSPYLILNIGRFAKNKRQDTLLEAMKYSRHSSGIQLYFAGNGQMLGKCRKLAGRLVADGVLRYEPVFAFHNDPKELKALAEKAYLYVHCSDLEVEGLGCIEAVREGAVPVISTGELVATSDFALDERSLYPAKDPKALAERIDWWIEHPEERIEMGQKYADSARKYSIHNSVNALIEMYREALAGR